MADDSKSPNVLKMQALLEQCRSDGFDGVRLFVPNSRDISVDDIAHDFCALEQARREGKVVAAESVNF